ncbi:MAG: universal stress protein [Planktotalea sp.]|uniref:universal stress protein n=1 Tax=Planktotalea sp. TaxID=2029877 RepID=UPI003C73592C
MYDRILVPIAIDHIDHAEQSLNAARHMLNAGGTISLVNVIEDIPSFVENYLPDGTLASNEQHANKAMDMLAHKTGHNYDAAVIHGKPHISIVEHAKKINADCIVIASHKPGLEDCFIGSTAGRVVRHAKCCVHVLR